MTESKPTYSELEQLHKTNTQIIAEQAEQLKNAISNLKFNTELHESNRNEFKSRIKKLESRIEELKSQITSKESIELIISATKDGERKKISAALIALSKIGERDGRGTADYADTYSRRSIRVIARDDFYNLTGLQVIQAIFDEGIDDDDDDIPF